MEKRKFLQINTKHLLFCQCEKEETNSKLVVKEETSSNYRKIISFRKFGFFRKVYEIFSWSVKNLFSRSV